jgi:hypothetical protein
MPLVLLNRRRRGTGFNPASLFGLNEQGVWYDPSDLTTLFTDTAGTTPVTTPGQTVALMLDKSKGLALGTEQSPAFPDYQTVLTGTWAASGANYVFTDTAGGQTRPGVQWPNISLLAGWYQLVVVVAAVNGATQVRLDNVGATDQLLTVGTNTRIVNVTSTSRPRFRLEDLSTTIGDSFTITSISVRELPGNHATQGTIASRPTYGVVPLGGRRNLLLQTEAFNEAVWTKVLSASVSANSETSPIGDLTADTFTAGAANSALRQTTTLEAVPYTYSVWLKRKTGTGTVEISVTGGSWSTRAITSAWERFTITQTPTAGSNFPGVRMATLGDEVYVWGAQLETGSTATAYQRVSTAFDVTEAGVQSLSYLNFEVSDFMVTPTITPGTDKAQVFAGVRVIGSSAGGMIAETSVDIGASNGALNLVVPNASPFGGRGFRSKGTIQGAADVGNSTYTAPITQVLSGFGDISGDVARLRVDGTQVAETLTDQGTGNYLAYPLYLGMRAGTSLPFNGNIFSLITRFGANLTTQQITDTETWVNGKTGAYV